MFCESFLSFLKRLLALFLQQRFLFQQMDKTGITINLLFNSIFSFCFVSFSSVMASNDTLHICFTVQSVCVNVLTVLQGVHARLMYVCVDMCAYVCVCVLMFV